MAQNAKKNQNSLSCFGFGFYYAGRMSITWILTPVEKEFNDNFNASLLHIGFKASMI